MANAWVRMRHPDYDVLREHARRRRPDRPGPRVTDRAAARRAGDRGDRGHAEHARRPAGRRRAVPDRRADGACTFAYAGPVDRCASPTSASACPTTSTFEPLGESGWWVLAAATCRAVPGSSTSSRSSTASGTHLVEDPLNPHVARHPFGANSVCEASGYERARVGPPRPTTCRPGRSVEFELRERGARPAGDRDACTCRPGFERRGDVAPAARRPRRRRLPAVRRRRDACSTTSSTAASSRRPSPRSCSPASASSSTPTTPATPQFARRRAGAPAGGGAPAARHAGRSLPDGRQLRRRRLAVGGVAVAGVVRAPAAAVGLVRRRRRSAAAAGRSRCGSRCVSSSERTWPRRRAVAERVFVSCGVYESLICENRGLVPVARGRPGWTSAFVEALDGHNWACWRDDLGHRAALAAATRRG